MANIADQLIKQQLANIYAGTPTNSQITRSLQRKKDRRMDASVIASYDAQYRAFTGSNPPAAQSAPDFSQYEQEYAAFRQSMQKPQAPAVQSTAEQPAGHLPSLRDFDTTARMINEANNIDQKRTQTDEERISEEARLMGILERNQRVYEDANRIFDANEAEFAAQQEAKRQEEARLARVREREFKQTKGNSNASQSRETPVTRETLPALRSEAQERREALQEKRMMQQDKKASQKRTDRSYSPLNNALMNQTIKATNERKQAQDVVRDDMGNIVSTGTGKVEKQPDTAGLSKKEKNAINSLGAKVKKQTDAASQWESPAVQSGYVSREQYMQQNKLKEEDLTRDYFEKFSDAQKEAVTRSFEEFASVPGKIQDEKTAQSLSYIMGRHYAAIGDNEGLQRAEALRKKTAGDAAAFGVGAVDVISKPGTVAKGLASKATGGSFSDTWNRDRALIEGTGLQQQNPLAYLGGQFAGNTLMYAAANGAVGSIAPINNAANTAGNAIAGRAANALQGLGSVGQAAAGALRNKGGEAIGNILMGTIPDLAFDTLPTEAANIANGMGAGDVALDTAKNIGVNTLFNIGGEALPSLKNAIGDRLRGTADDVVDAARLPVLGDEAWRKSSEQIKAESDSIAEQIGQMGAGTFPSGDYIRLGDTPGYMNAYGDASNPLVMSQNTAFKAAYPEGYQGGNHNLGFQSISEVPNRLNDPAAVMESLTQRNSGVVLTDMIDPQGNPVIAPIHMNKNTSGGTVNEIASMYGKSDAEGLLNRSNTIFRNEEKIQNALSGKGLQLSELTADSDPFLKNTVSQTAAEINPPSASMIEDVVEEAPQLPLDLQMFGKVEELIQEGQESNFTDGFWNEVIARAERGEFGSAEEAAQVLDAVETAARNYTPRFGALEGDAAYQVKYDLDNIRDAVDKVIPYTEKGEAKIAEVKQYLAAYEEALKGDSTEAVDEARRNLVNSYGRAHTAVKADPYYRGELNKKSLKDMADDAARRYHDGRPRTEDEVVGNVAAIFGDEVSEDEIREMYHRFNDDELPTLRAETTEPQQIPSLEAAPRAETPPVPGDLNNVNLPNVNQTAEPAEQISKLRSNTMQNAGISNEAELANQYAEDVYKYTTKTEKQSLDEAVSRFTTDRDKYARKYLEDFSTDAAKRYGAEDADTMMLLYNDLNTRARAAAEAGDIAEANRLYADARDITLNIRKAATEAGQFNQALAKWTRTADGAIAAGQGILEKNVDDVLAQSPKLKKDIGEVAQAIDDELVKLQAEDLWAQLEAGSISDAGKDELRGRVEEIVQSAIDSKKRVADAAGDLAAKDIADNIIERQFADVQRELEYISAGFDELDADVYQRVEDLFTEAEKYGVNSKQRVKYENEAYATIANAISHGKSFGEKLDQWRYFSMLANPKTHIRNIVGNAMFGAESGIKNNVAALLESGIDRVSRATGNGGIDRTKAILNPVRDADFIKSSYDDFMENMYRNYSGNRYVDVGRSIDAAIPTWDNNTKLGKLLNTITEGASKPLDAEDVMAGAQKYSTSLAGFLKANGADKSIFEATDDASKDLLESAREYALQQAKLATFHQDNRIADAFSQFTKGLRHSDSSAAKALGYALDVSIPFKKTPANILESVVSYSPFEFARVMKETPGLMKGTVKAADYIDDIAKGLTGTGAMVFGAWLAREGILDVSTGDYKEEGYNKLIGSQSMSIHVGGHDIKISELAPASVPLILGGIYQKEYREKVGDDDKALNTVIDGASAMGNAVTDMTMLSGITDVLSSIRYADSDANIWKELGMTVAENALSQMFPTVGGNIERIIDDTQRSTYSDKSGAAKKLESTVRYLTQKIPGLQAAGERMQQSELPVLQNIGSAIANEPKIDARGREVKNVGGNAAGRAAYNLLSPATISKNSATDNDLEIKRIAEAVGDTSILTYTATKEAKVKGLNGEHQMTPKEWTQYQKDKGQMSTKLEDSLFASDKYDGLQDADRANILGELHSFSMNYNQNKIVPKELTNKQKEYSEVYEKQGADALVDKIITDSIGSELSKAAGVTAGTNAGKAITSLVEQGKVEEAQTAAQSVASIIDAGLPAHAGDIYLSAQQKLPSLTADEFVTAFKAVDKDGNGGLKQDEVIAAMNRDPENAKRYERMFWKTEGKGAWSKIPVLGDDGKYTAKKR